MTTQSELNFIIEKNENRYRKHLNESADSMSIILKGHLFIEEILQEIILLHCQNPKIIENTQISFSLKLKFSQALLGNFNTGSAIPEEIWPVLESINKLRNSLAHSIDGNKSNENFKSFIITSINFGRRFMEIEEKNEPTIENTSKNDLLHIMNGLLGYLGALYGIVFLNKPPTLMRNPLNIMPEKR